MVQRKKTVLLLKTVKDSVFVLIVVIEMALIRKVMVGG